ncbi:hemolysin III family protein [Aminipila butyrica]|uniref:Hemolysin III family protein n=1 Tax=Aminipila butyrica TaxID=433296 RepID=A0A858BUC4_9FIRM|nr:hemolysin III family protein [Aminipila butyrica]QIB69543.1 hemolysin III family protein [Aminipila butyrica]
MPIYKQFMNARDPLSSFTHFIGACMAVGATLLLIGKCLYLEGTHPMTIVSAVIFGLSMIALYSTSSIYHFVKVPAPILVRIRKLDHSMIYVLIAGTYTPIVIGFMDLKRAAVFMGAIWLVALVGILIKVCSLHAPRWLYTSLYLLMGWAIVFDLDFLRQIPLEAILLIAVGGVMYSIGAGFYIAKKPNFSKAFGFHEIFHIFVILGTVFQYSAIYLYAI